MGGRCVPGIAAVADQLPAAGLSTVAWPVPLAAPVINAVPLIEFLTRWDVLM